MLCLCSWLTVNGLPLTYRQLWNIRNVDSCLSEVVMEAATSILKTQFPSLVGLTAPHLQQAGAPVDADLFQAAVATVASATTNLFQVVYTPNHWVLVHSSDPGSAGLGPSVAPTLLCRDSLGRSSATRLTLVTATMRRLGSVSKLEYGACPRQSRQGCSDNSGLDCGLHVLCNIMALASGRDPSGLRYQPSRVLRMWLERGLCSGEAFDYGFMEEPVTRLHSGLPLRTPAPSRDFQSLPRTGTSMYQPCCRPPAVDHVLPVPSQRPLTEWYVLSHTRCLHTICRSCTHHNAKHVLKRMYTCFETTENMF